MFSGIAAQYAKAPLTLKASERARFWVVAAGPGDGISFGTVGTWSLVRFLHVAGPYCGSAASWP
ncbi:copper oxidase [Streptomyces olivaceoviridis]